MMRGGWKEGVVELTASEREVFASPRYELLFSLIGFQFLPVAFITSSVSSQRACIVLIRSKG